MLPAAHRMRRSTDFTSVVRGGTRAGTRTLVVHHRRRDTAGVPIAGLVVGRGVGGSVVRHQVSRRLRAQLAGRITALPAGSALVVRALPPSASASSVELGHDLDRAIARAVRR